MKLHSEAFGKGPDLVLLHGWGMNSAVWDNFGHGLAEQFRVHVIELPGHGASEFDSHGVAFEHWVSGCLAAAPSKAVWLGWSLGGLIALGAALRAPQRMSQLAVIASSPCFIQDAGWPHAMKQETFSSFYAMLETDVNEALDYFLRLQALGGEEARHSLRLLRGHLYERPLARSDALASGLNLLAGTDLRSSLSDLSVPSIWLFGEHDGLVPQALAAGIKEMVPHATTRVIRGAAHVPFLSHPSESLQALQSFLVEAA